MPIRLDYPDGGKGAIMTATGALTGEELVAATIEVFRRDLLAEPYLYLLFDADGTSAFEVSTPALLRVAELDARAARTLPALVVAVYANTTLAFGLARMWESFVQRTGWQTHVFADRAEAVAWLTAEVAHRHGRTVTLN